MCTASLRAVANTAVAAPLRRAILRNEAPRTEDDLLSDNAAMRGTAAIRLAPVPLFFLRTG